LGHIVERCRRSCYYFFSRIRMSSSADFTVSFRSHCAEMSPCARVSWAINVPHRADLVPRS